MWIFFRSVALIISPMILAIVTVTMTMGLLIGLRFTVHIMSSMIPIFLMPIAVVDSVHILSEIHDECVDAGLPVMSVVKGKRGVEVCLAPGATADQKAAAEIVVSDVLNRKTIVPKNVIDAMVVLHFDPRNAAALALVKQRYMKLRGGGS